MRSRPLIPASVAAAAAFSLLAAGCGSGASTTVGSSAGGNTHAAGLLAYSYCMRSHGVPKFPDPAGSGGIPKDAVLSAIQGVSNSHLETAGHDCRHLLPAGGSLSGQASHTVAAQQQQDYLNAAACMRSHGITSFPDPTFSGGNVDLHIPASIKTDSTPFRTAERTCQKLIPGGLPYSSPGDS
jgi:hypothetical protein